MIGYKDREVKPLVQSKVYYNLHKRCFSVQQAGLVVLHTRGLMLTDVSFQVNESGRKQVLIYKRKNVHAYVNGIFQGEYTETVPEGYREAYYNPYRMSTFVDKESSQPLYEADTVILVDKKIYYK